MGRYFLKVAEARMSKGRIFEFWGTDLRRLETWDQKQREAAWQKRYEISLAEKRTKELKRTRKPASLAKGIADYRKKRGLSRTDFADELGVTRRSLYNYETGATPVPGDIVEKIVTRGDVELSDIFGLRPEAPHRRCRLDDARLAISLFAACLKAYRSAPVDKVITHVLLKVADWPLSVRRTDHSIKRVAQRLTDDLADEEMAEELDKELKNPSYESLILAGDSDEALAESVEQQFQLLQQSYATGDDEQFDQALTRVTEVRRMKANGVLDMIRERMAEPDP
jgi:transcriptional regulator with XRE-family HTH domain